MLLIARQHVPTTKIAPGSPPSRPLRAACGGGLAASLDCGCARRSGQPSGQSNNHERCALDINDKDRNMPLINLTA